MTFDSTICTIFDDEAADGAGDAAYRRRRAAGPDGGNIERERVGIQMGKKLLWGLFFVVMALAGLFSGYVITTAISGETPVQTILRWREEDTGGTSKPVKPPKKDEKDRSDGKTGNQDAAGDEADQSGGKNEKDLSGNSQGNVYQTGETWTVDGQWSLTVTGVTETDYRNEYSEKTPSAVYVIDYSYTNWGYHDESGLMDGLFFGMEDTIVDAGGVMGYSYPGELTDYPQETPEGATCHAQSCIGVDNAGNFQITVTQYDGTGTKQSATFALDVG